MLSMKLTSIDSDDLCKYNTGLGNVLYQLSFQYCLTKKYNIKNNYNFLKILVNKLKTFELNDYEKTIFRNLWENIDHTNYTTNTNHLTTDIDYDIILKETQPHIYDEKLIQTIIDNKTQNILIKNSYLQSIFYFNEYEKTIQNLFSPDNKSTDYMKIKYPTIFDTDNNINISIHLRLKWGANLSYKSDYFQDAIKYINENVIEKNNQKNNQKNINYYVFSDDIDQSHAILKNIDNLIYVSNNNDYIDLWLMSLCNHNIICHSTLGWWGAYLNKNINKCVVYGSDISKYFFGSILGKASVIEKVKNNYFPKEWICIDSNSIYRH